MSTTTQRIATLTGPPRVDLAAADLRDDELLQARADDDLAARSISGSAYFILIAGIVLLTNPLEPVRSAAFGIGVLLLASSRLAVVRRRAPGWRRRFALLTVGLGLVWGELSAIGILTRPFDPAVLLLLLCVAGIGAASMFALSGARRVQVVFALALLAPPIAALAARPLDRSSSGLLLMLLTYVTFILLQGRRIHREYRLALETARRLELVNQEVEAASRAKSHFIADMSHELRTPMTAIRGFSDLLLDSELDEADREYVHTILRNSDHLLAIINEVLDLARVEAGRMKIEVASTCPARIALDVQALLGERAAGKGIALEARVAGVVPAHIQSDQLRVRQILINLVSNAIRHTDSGRVTLTLALDEEAPAPRLRVAVEDTGVGMTPDQLARLFQPFCQVDRSAERRAGGTGLGLVISRKLAEALGGSIEITSQPGRGTVATLLLPTGPLAGVPLWRGLRGGATEEAAAGPERAGRLSGRVLVAEDDDDNRRLIRTQLERAGATVEVTGDGAAAAERALAAAAAGTPFHVVLMDMRMPRTDGYQATRALRQAGYRGPIVALTAQAMVGDRERCLAAGCDDFLVKPIEGRQLLDALTARLPPAG